MEMTSKVEIDQENIAMMEIVDDVVKSTESSQVELVSSSSSRSSEDEVTSKIGAMEIENEKFATATDQDEDQEVDQPETVKKNNRILVSNTKKPFFVYLNLAKKCISQYNAVELAAVGMAIPTVIKIAEVNRTGSQQRRKIPEIVISSISSKEPGTIRKKPRFEIVMVKAIGHKENENPNTIDTATTEDANEKVALACS